MGAIASQITSLTIVYSTVYPDADQSRHQSSASLAFVWEIHRGPVNFPHKWPVTRKMFPFDDVIMVCKYHGANYINISSFGRTPLPIYTPRHEQNEPHFADDIFKCILTTGKIEFSFKFPPYCAHIGKIDKNSTLVHVMGCLLGSMVGKSGDQINPNWCV